MHLFNQFIQFAERIGGTFYLDKWYGITFIVLIVLYVYSFATGKIQ